MDEQFWIPCQNFNLKLELYEGLRVPSACESSLPRFDGGSLEWPTGSASVVSRPVFLYVDICWPGFRHSTASESSLSSEQAKVSLE